MSFIIERPRDDGRISFWGHRFVGNIIETPHAEAAESARRLGWKVRSKAEILAERLSLNEPEIVEEPAANLCPVCKRVFKNANGLRLHIRSHKE